MIVYHQGGLAFRSENNNYTCLPGEVGFPDYATVEQLTAAFPDNSAAIIGQYNDFYNTPIIAEINKLEQIQLRCMREICVGKGDIPDNKGVTPKKRLKDIDDAIIAFREQLKK